MGSFQLKIGFKLAFGTSFPVWWDELNPITGNYGRAIAARNWLNFQTTPATHTKESRGAETLVCWPEVIHAAIPVVRTHRGACRSHRYTRIS
jgi:hypothetical protein